MLELYVLQKIETITGKKQENISKSNNWKLYFPLDIDFYQEKIKLYNMKCNLMAGAYNENILFSDEWWRASKRGEI